MVNLSLLMEEFATAGIVNVFPDSNGDLTWNELATQQEKDDAAALVLAHNPAALSKQQEIDQARAALTQIRQYLLRQLVKVSPDSPTVRVATIKAIANGNIYLARIMTNQIDAMNGAFGWSLTNNPTTAQTRLQYIVTVEILTGVLPQA